RRLGDGANRRSSVGRRFDAQRFSRLLAAVDAAYRGSDARADARAIDLATGHAAPGGARVLAGLSRLVVDRRRGGGAISIALAALGGGADDTRCVRAMPVTGTAVEPRDGNAADRRQHPDRSVGGLVAPVRHSRAVATNGTWRLNLMICGN